MWPRAIHTCPRGKTATVRRKIAERYRCETCLGMVDIATLLGYSEYGTFTHCALRWTGKAPSATVRASETIGYRNSP